MPAKAWFVSAITTSEGLVRLSNYHQRRLGSSQQLPPAKAWFVSAITTSEGLVRLSNYHQRRLGSSQQSPPAKAWFVSAITTSEGLVRLSNYHQRRLGSSQQLPPEIRRGRRQIIRMVNRLAAIQKQSKNNNKTCYFSTRKTSSLASGKRQQHWLHVHLRSSIREFSILPSL